MDQERTEREAAIGLSLDQHCREIAVIERKLNNPDLPPDKRKNLIARAPIVKKKIFQLSGSLQAG